ncbi:type II toxin-antitoxin system VapC family toxin [Skermanella rosea]|uniref:type II toxin-antitoxin system VapC family toxin n=1 Tax=Skermanella rosea TaxID=1817965 RepID=UPI002B21BB8D|nr:type II toxin-antitoxin system VapC family toxin [Skermanella rosea]
MTAPLYMLDTNIVSDLIRNPAGKAAHRIMSVGDKALCTSIVVAGELRYGCARKSSPKLTRKVDEILSVIPVLPFDVPADADYGRIRCELEQAGLSIGGNDLLIAAHAMVLGLTLVTANTREFSRVSGLRVENWLE